MGVQHGYKYDYDWFSREQNTAIQEALFNLGFTWGGADTVVDHNPDNPYRYITTSSKLLTFSRRDDVYYFIEHTYPSLNYSVLIHVLEGAGYA